MMKPLISVVMPAHNNASTIKAALDSILNQTYPSIEVLVVDDNSTDDTKQIVGEYAKRDPRVRCTDAPDDPHRYDTKLKRNVNAGWSARNAGLALCRGELVTFQDGDDVSLLNRLEVQYELLHRHNAMHITTNCTDFRDERVGTSYLGPLPEPTLGPEQISRLARRAKGFIPAHFPALNRAIPFHSKRWRVINKLFFGTLESYPGAGNSPLFRREVLKQVQFRPLREREWPSFMGRGADRDFNFNVAATFGASYFFDIPLYLWRTDR